MADTRSNICQPSIAGHHRDCPDDDECACERLYQLDNAIKDSETLDERMHCFTIQTLE
jgi:hypothetical protein